MNIPTPKAAESVVDMMFSAMQDHYHDLEKETNNFFKKEVVRLPVDGSLEVCVFGGLPFHSLRHKGKTMIIPEDQVDVLMKTSVEKVIRKRYALHVIAPNLNISESKAQAGYPLVPADYRLSRDNFRSCVIEAIPSVVHGFSESVKVAGSRVRDSEHYPGICSGDPGMKPIRDSYIRYERIDDVIRRPVFKIVRTPRERGTGRCLTFETYRNLSQVLRRQDMLGNDILKAINLPDIYRSELWDEKLRNVILELKKRGFL